jgi:hypothetical protein
MNLFRSEEHVPRWWAYDPGAAEGTLPLAEWARVFGGQYYRRRLDPDFYLHGLELRQELFQVLRALGKSGSFWGLSRA